MLPRPAPPAPLVRQTIRLLRSRKTPIQKMRTMLQVHPRHPLHLHNINPMSNNTHPPILHIPTPAANSGRKPGALAPNSPAHHNPPMPTTTHPNPNFAATRWTLILSANNWRTDTSAHRALNQLAALYWFPLYAYARRQGNSPAESEDLIQSFFTRLLEKNALSAADRSKGKFRSFLLASLKNFLLNEHDKSHAKKRGGTRPLLSLDTLDAEARYAAEPAHNLTPDRLFERRWALALLDQVLLRLRHHYADRNQLPLLQALEQTLVAGTKISHAQLATQLHMTPAAVKVAAHRLRKHFRQLLREEIAHTLSDPDQIDDEIRQLLNSL